MAIQKRSMLILFIFLIISLASCSSGIDEMHRIQDTINASDKMYSQFAFQELTKYETSKSNSCRIERIVKTGFLERHPGSRVNEAFIPVVAETKCGQKKYYFCSFTERKCTRKWFQYPLILLMPSCIWRIVPVEGLFIAEVKEGKHQIVENWCNDIRPPDSNN